MVRKERMTAIVVTGLMVSVLLACKKKPEATPEASATPPAVTAPATPAPTPTPVPTPATPDAPTGGLAKLGDVKRYGIDKEKKLDDAGVRVSADELKVFNEADVKTPEVATLPKGLLVFRLVSVDDFQLVEFPSGIGQFSQGWVETKGLSDTPEKVSRDAALNEKKTASVKVVDGGAPKPTPSGSAAPKPTPSGSAAPKPTPSGSAAPKPTPSGSAAPKPKPSSTKPVPPPPPKPKKDDKK
jgi:hypothetical protein